MVEEVYQIKREQHGSSQGKVQFQGQASARWLRRNAGLNSFVAADVHSSISKQ